jgi:hypothetical protein
VRDFTHIAEIVDRPSRVNQKIRSNFNWAVILLFVAPTASVLFARFDGRGAEAKTL